MLTEWTLPASGGKYLYRVTLDGDQVNLSGGDLGPVLTLFPSIYRVGDASPNENLGKDIMAIAAEVFPEGAAADPPLFASGLQPLGWNQHSVTLRVTREYIEYITSRSVHAVVSIRLRFALFVTVSEMSDVSMMFSTPGDVQIPVARWHEQLLPRIGFPKRRMVPLDMAVADGVAVAAPLATTAWAKAANHLTTAMKKFYEAHDPSEAVAEARFAIEGAVHTWAYAWGCSTPPEDLTFALALKFIEDSAGIKAGQKVEGNAARRRFWSRLSMLKTLHGVASDGHHIGRKTIATRDDADALVTACVGVLRLLPGFLGEFPEAPSQESAPTA